MKLLTLLVVLVLPALAFADEAEDHVAKGTRFYNIQDWESALKEYRQAYKLDPKPDTLWAVAQTQRLSGDCRGAVLTYKAYMRGASTAGANAAEDFIKQCEVDLAAQQRALDAPAPAKPAPTIVPPSPAAKVDTGPKPPGPWFLDPLGDTLFVVGVGGLATGGTFLVLGNQHMSDAANAPTSGDYAKATSDARADQKIGVIAAAAGAAFTGLAIWRFVAVASRAKQPAHRARETPVHAFNVMPTRSGAFASYVLSF